MRLGVVSVSSRGIERKPRKKHIEIFPASTVFQGCLHGYACCCRGSGHVRLHSRLSSFFVSAKFQQRLLGH